MIISWGVRQRYKFTAAGALATWTAPVIPAVYAITYKQDPERKPKSHTVLYFGQAEDISTQAAVYNRSVLEVWHDNGGDIKDLFIFVHPMPGSNSWERGQVHQQLIAEYGPECNKY
jgi:hypothetical protein